MKPVYLEFCGINSFSECAKVDFRSLLSYGIFGIFGDTGSGKSTILDCIGFALYGAVARASRGVGSDIINLHHDKAYVYFEFEIFYEGRRRYFRIEREIKRKNAAQSLRVYEKKDDTLLVLADTVREGNHLIGDIIGLEQRDFERCIALPQGEFAQFVKATRAERLTLVSRLFNLEEYGERLVRKAKARSDASQNKLSLLSVRMEQYEGVSEEKCQAYENSIVTLQTKENDCKSRLVSLRKQEKELSALLEKQRELRSLCKRLHVLESQREEIAMLECEIGRISKAEQVVKADEEVKRCRADYEHSARTLVTIAEQKTRAKIRLKSTESFDEEQADSEIIRLTELSVRLEQAENDAKKRLKLKNSLSEAREQYRQEAEKFLDFSYDEQKSKLQAALASCGDDNFFDFVEKHAKSYLLAGEYKTFATQLCELAQKFPIIGDDVAPLIERYNALSIGGGQNVADVRKAYEEQRKEKNRLQEELSKLETQNASYQLHCERLRQLKETGVRLKEELSLLGKEQTERQSLADCTRLLGKLKKEKQERQKNREEAMRESNDVAIRFATSLERKNLTQNAFVQAQERLNNTLKQAEFSNADEAIVLCNKYGAKEAVSKRIDDFKSEYASVSSRYKALSVEDYSNIDEGCLLQIRAALSETEQETEDVTKQLALVREDLRRDREKLKQKDEVEKQQKAVKAQLEIDEKLKKLLEKNKFMDFVAEEYLQNVAQNASARLLSFTDGQYFLRYEGGATGFVVGDNCNGGSTRGVYMMSGGETFLVSLSLALSLSSEICARSSRPIEFFFLDEGFGTLDERLVDIVMDSLERLKSENFSIGIISHVEELKHRIVKKLLVKKATAEHGSQIFA